MSGKNQYPSTFNWQSTDPRIGFMPNPTPSGSLPSGTVGGVMSSTNTIYSNIVDVAKMDNLGLEFDWTGSPVGTLSIYGSVSGLSWFAVTPSPALSQPAGSASGELTGFNQYPYKYIMLKYVNSSGSGVLTAYMQAKDLN